MYHAPIDASLGEGFQQILGLNKRAGTFHLGCTQQKLLLGVADDFGKAVGQIKAFERVALG
jgi:hypothetical protein